MTEELSDNLIEHEQAVGRLLNVLQSGGPHRLALARAQLPRFAAADDAALHNAAVAGRPETVRYLVEHGADRSAEDREFGSTPAGYAAWAGNEDVVEHLETSSASTGR